MGTSRSATVTVRTPKPTSQQSPRRRVVDAPTRMFHWLFAATFTGAWLTGESEHWQWLHVMLGYAFGGLLGFRVLYGLVGPRHARLAGLWRRAASARVIVVMLALAAPLVLSGYGTRQAWGDALGDEWLAEVHEFFAEAMLGAVFAHLGLLAGLSLLQRCNRALPMLTGHVPGKGPDLVRHNRSWLAALLAVAVVGCGAWSWFDPPRDPRPDRESASRTWSVRPSRNTARSTRT